MSNDFLSQRLQKSKDQHTYRSLVDHDYQIDFNSNDFLGLGRSSELANIILEEVDKTTFTGSGGSRLLGGNHRLHEETEDYLASVLEAESCLLFNSGYHANVGLLSALGRKGDTILYDELAHASIKDGARLSMANRYSFKHNDISDLRLKLEKATGEVFVVSEAIFSMDGDFCDLDRLVDICYEFGAKLIIDEAHSTGLFSKGKGYCVHLGRQDEVFARVYTFGKALATTGACVCGSQELKNYLINFSRTFIYTTAMNSYNLVSVKKGFEYIQGHPELWENLQLSIQYFRDCFGSNSGSAIQPVSLQSIVDVDKTISDLNENDIYLKPINYPTVPKGSERFRVCLHSFQTKKEIDLLTHLLSV